MFTRPRIEQSCDKKSPSWRSPVKGPLCARCRNHGVYCLRKGHSTCPYKGCQCREGCYLIKQRTIISEEQKRLKKKDNEEENCQKGSKSFFLEAMHAAMLAPPLDNDGENDISITMATPMLRPTRLSLAEINAITNRGIAVLAKVFPEHSVPSIINFIGSSNGDLLTTMEQMVSFRDLRFDAYCLPSNSFPQRGCSSTSSRYQMAALTTSQAENAYLDPDVSVLGSYHPSYMSPYCSPNNYASYMKIHRDQNYTNTVAEELAKNLAYRAISRDQIGISANSVQHDSSCEGNEPVNHQLCTGNYMVGGNHVGWWASGVTSCGSPTGNSQKAETSGSDGEDDDQSLTYGECSDTSTPPVSEVDDAIGCMSDDQDIGLDNITPTIPE